MTRSELTAAGDALEAAAAEATDSEATERLETLAEQLQDLAEADQGPDHGRLARIQAALNEVEGEVSGGVVERIEDADAEINAYRENLEGV
jgi:tRNA A22 N-methylase